MNLEHKVSDVTEPDREFTFKNGWMVVSGNNTVTKGPGHEGWWSPVMVTGDDHDKGSDRGSSGWEDKYQSYYTTLPIQFFFWGLIIQIW